MRFWMLFGLMIGCSSPSGLYKEVRGNPNPYASYNPAGQGGFGAGGGNSNTTTVYSCNDICAVNYRDDVEQCHLIWDNNSQQIQCSNQCAVSFNSCSGNSYDCGNLFEFCLNGCETNLCVDGAYDKEINCESKC